MTSGPPPTTPDDIDIKEILHKQWPLIACTIVILAGTIVIVWLELAHPRQLAVYSTVYFFWGAVSLTVLSWFSRRIGGMPLARLIIPFMWGIAVLASGATFGSALTTAMLSAYQYAGRNYIPLQTVSGVFTAGATVVYVLCTIALVWQAQRAQMRQDRAAQTQIAAQHALAEEQAKTNASLAASLAALTTLLEEQRTAAKALHPASPPPNGSLPGQAPPVAVPARHDGRVVRAWRELTTDGNARTRGTP